MSRAIALDWPVRINSVAAGYKKGQLVHRAPSDRLERLRLFEASSILLQNVKGLFSYTEIELILDFSFAMDDRNTGSDRRIEGRQSSRSKCHIDEVFVKISGEQHYLWRAASHEGEVLENFATKSRNMKSELKFLMKAMYKRGRPEGLYLG